MAILYGTQSNGETLPVLVDQYGNLLALGIDGQPGEPGSPGPPGPEGPQGEPGPNDLLPYGPEYSYLSIKGGVPQWVLSNNEPNPPGPPSELMLDDTRDETSEFTKKFGSWGLQEELVFPPDPWDTYVRTLPTWETPGPQKMGIGGLTKVDDKVDFNFGMTLLGGFDKLLQITFSWQYEGKSGMGSSSDLMRAEILCDNEQLPCLSERIEFKGKEGIFDYTDQFVFLPMRPDLGYVTFRARVRKLGNWVGGARHVFIQKWEYIDAAKYLLQRMKTASELITTTDIDLSRPTQD